MPIVLLLAIQALILGTKNLYADSIILKELSDRQSVSVLGIHLVQRGQVRTWASRFGDKGQHWSMLPCDIHS